MIGIPVKDYFSFLDPFGAFVRTTKYGEMQDIVGSVGMSLVSLQKGGLKALTAPEYLEMESRMLQIRSPCAMSYHFIFKMVVQCI